MKIQDKIIEVINKAEQQYEKCWDILAQFKSYEQEDGSIQEIVRFQPLLGEILFSLTNEYNRISNVKRKLIKSKGEVDPSEFERNIRTYARLLDRLNATINLGKGLGDAYVWLFYKSNRDYLEKHLQHKPNVRFPSGIGGIGEIEFVKNIGALEGHLVIYHSITNILRIGDVSFINLSNLELTAIGEIKSKKAEKNKLELSVTFIGPKIFDSFKFWQKKNAKKRRPILNSLPEQMKSRAKRQVRRMQTAFEEIQKQKTDAKINLSDKTHISAMSEIMKESKEKSFIYKKVDHGLTLGAIKLKEYKLAEKMGLGNYSDSFHDKLGSMKDQVMEITDKTSKENSMKINSLLYDANFNIRAIPGMIPLFWWPIPVAQLKDIYFQKVIVITLFNSIHLRTRLIKEGFKIKLNKKNRGYSVLLPYRKGTLKFERFQYFLDLISYNLFSENAIFIMIKSFVEEIKQKNIPYQTKVELRIFQEL